MADATDSYARFAPARLVRRHAAHPAPPDALHVESCRGAVLVADILGYTALTEEYSRRGAQGVEQLKELLNTFFRRLETEIAESGGDIISFAGDSLLALWDTGDGDAPADAVLQAARCAWAAQQALDGDEKGNPARLRMRIGIEAGDILLATVGGVDGHWEYVAVGEPVANVGAAMQRAEPGGVVLGAAAWQWVAPQASGHALSDGRYQLLAIDAPHVRDREEKAVAATPTPALRSYILRPVLEHLDAGQQEWLLEFRRATTVFVAVRDIDYRAREAPARLQSAVVAIQSVVRRLEGTLARVIVDDKGTNVLCIWGIPGLAHEDDPRRAVLAAFEMREALHSLGITCGSGIATGRVLCGLTGGSARCEYTVTGDTINLAAKMMAPAGGHILCDDATRISARALIEFEPHPPLHVKGREHPVPVHRPRQPASDTLASAMPVTSESPQRSRFVGRDRERDRLLGGVAALRSGSASMFTVVGEPGVGKSRLIAELLDVARARRIGCLVGRPDVIQRNTTYFTWRTILQGILNEQAGDDAAAWREYLRSQFAAPGKIGEWLPLLNDVLAMGIAANAATAAMGEKERAEHTTEMLLHVVRQQVARGPTLVVLEDAHLMDSMSWQVAEQLQHRVGPLMLVLAIRSGQAPDADAARRLLAQHANRRIALDPLSRTDTEILICDRLQAHSVADAVVSFVHGKTDGHPLFSEELCLALRDQGRFRFDDGHCRFAGEPGRSESIEVPDTIEMVISSRIDRLPVAEKTTLKVASVVGGAFPAHLVSAIHPDGLDVGQVTNQLQTMGALDLLRRDDGSVEELYAFKHAITRDATYKLLPPVQRLQVHHNVASWYEQAHDDDLGAVYPLLAHHWTEADVPVKAMDYLHKSGVQAFNRYANRDAVDFLERATQMMSRVDELSSRSVRVDCERLLGYARLWIGDVTKSQASLERGLALLGQPVPASRAALLLGIVVGLVRATGVGLFGPWFSRHRAPPDEAERNAAIGVLRLAHIAYLNGDKALTLYTALRCIGFVERREPSCEMAIICAALTPALGGVPLHALARRYVRMATQAAESLADPACTAQVLMYTSMYGAGLGETRDSLQKMQQAMEISRRIGDGRRTEECLVVSGFLHYNGGEFDAALTDFSAMVAAANVRGDQQTGAWGLLGVARVRLAQGRPEDATPALEQARPLAPDRVSMIELHGLSALAHFQRGDLPSSLGAGKSALALVLADRPSSFSTLSGTAAMTAALLGLWIEARAGTFVADPAALERDSRLALRALRAFARVFPVGLPQALIQEGRFHEARGDLQSARRCWGDAMATASRLGMPHEHARADALIERFAERRSTGPRVPASGEAPGR